MPYSYPDNVPNHVKKLPAKKQRQWVAIWNSAYSRCIKNGGKADTCEPRAFRQANGVVLAADGAEEDAVTVAGMATFDLGEARLSDQDEVLRYGLLFRAGDYPDKQFGMTPEELAGAVEAFDGPVPLDLEHVPTVLDGKLGELCSVELGDDGASLYGVVALPAWLDTALDGAARKVSTTWNRATKTLAGLALVVTPRVEDAALMGAYAAYAAARHDTPHGQMAMQMLHDAATQMGAVCKQANARLASRHEADAVQQIHDIATTHGATCSAMKAGERPMMFAEAGERRDVSPATSTPPVKEGKRMSKLEDFFRGLLGEGGEAVAGAAVAELGAGDTPPAGQAPPARTDEDRNRLEREVATLKAQNERLVAERIASEATAFADKAIVGGHAFPPEREALIAAYSQAAIDDAAVGVIRLSAGGTSSRVALLVKTVESRPTHQLLEERLKASPHLATLFNVGDRPDPNAPADEARLKELLSKTALGAAALTTPNGKGN